MPAVMLTIGLGPCKFRVAVPFETDQERSELFRLLDTHKGALFLPRLREYETRVGMSSAWRAETADGPEVQTTRDVQTWLVDHFSQSSKISSDTYLRRMGLNRNGVPIARKAA